MYKTAAVKTASALKDAENIMGAIYRENPRYWPHGLDARHFDGGLYLVREKRSNTPVGFCGWQERIRFQPFPKEAGAFGVRPVKTGFYSIGILPGHRGNRYAKSAVARLIAEKAAGVDEVRAFIVAENTPSRALAESLRVPVELK